MVGQLDVTAPEAAEFRAVIDNVRSYLHGVSALAAGERCPGGDGPSTTPTPVRRARPPARWRWPWRWPPPATGPASRRRPTCSSRWRWPTRRGWRRSPGWPGRSTPRPDGRGGQGPHRRAPGPPAAGPGADTGLSGHGGRRLRPGGGPRRRRAGAPDQPGTRGAAEAELAASLYRAALAALPPGRAGRPTGRSTSLAHRRAGSRRRGGAARDGRRHRRQPPAPRPARRRRPHPPLERVVSGPEPRPSGGRCRDARGTCSRGRARREGRLQRRGAGAGRAPGVRGRGGGRHPLLRGLRPRPRGRRARPPPVAGTGERAPARAPRRAAPPPSRSHAAARG